MPVFTKIPVAIEARQYTRGGDTFALLNWINEGQRALARPLAAMHSEGLMIPTLEGQHIASDGDWIIRGVAGEHYPCKPDIFARTYAPADSGVECVSPVYEQPRWGDPLPELMAHAVGAG